jgi:CheY-like chemotaxis protein
LQGSRVLVVDDNEASALLLCEMLSELGFVVQQVHSGQAALDHLAVVNQTDKPYEFVLMDWQMPGMDGLQTVKAIQALPIHAAPCVLMVTAHRRQELLKGARHLGIEHVLSKPVSGSLLVNAMMQIRGFAVALGVAQDAGANPSLQEAHLDALVGARVLLVEDNEINQQVACELLRAVGFVVDVADNGEIAVAQVQARFQAGVPYDIVLMDMQMPVMDGVTASRLIRETFGAEQLPIVAMTANAMKADRERCLGAGMNGFVTKPIDPEELWKALLSLVNIRAGMGGQAQFSLPQTFPANDAAQDVVQALRAIPLLDVDLGLQRTTNNPVFYASLLRKFVAAQQDATERVQQALRGGDLATAERIAHTLRGVAGNLGASDLQDSAAQLEAALRSGALSSEVDLALDHTAATLQQLMQQLKAAPGMFPQATSVLAAELSDGERDGARLVLEQIRQLLLQDDASALDLWESHAPVLRSLYPQAQQIETAIASFDFERALQLLR